VLPLAAVLYLLIKRVKSLRPTGNVNRLLSQARTPLALDLVALPLFISIRQNIRITVILLFALLLVSLLRPVISRADDSQDGKLRLNLIPAILMMVCVALVFWRGTFIIAAIYVLAVLIMINTARTVTRATAYASLLAGLSLFVVGNTIGWLIGLRSPSSAVRLGGYETGGDFFSSRVFFPFAVSINEPAILAAALITAVAAMISLRQRIPWYLWLGSAAGALVIVASNSRAPILLAVPVIAFLLLAPRATRALAPYAVGFSMLLPFLMVQLQPLLNSLAEFVVSIPFLARTQNFKDIVGLSSRGDIWSRSIDYWSTHVTDTMHELIGYGYSGHSASGALRAYDTGSGGYFTDRAALTMHNSLLQTLFDTGLLGAAILLGVTMFTVYRYGRSSQLLPMLAVGLMLGLSAATEVILAPGFSNTPAFVLIYLAVFIPVRPQSSTSSDPATRDAWRHELGNGSSPALFDAVAGNR
jgi:hypothetical protein